mmetsp:Transcript_27139/g.37736  ORF Transcript_27139/g.37736 Transcript_27139/m.37736 type:complete len:441 (-) Transcript_27139:65-1387(-)|eukprot:CAMPEP_0201484564 /NCGR_PEP_ID=MMETSP0151_2-20130828/8735_1 /ASSEMBLY_ACC=CAM_ASM_000257 /TAXON_ID=200890 /ORGANISM="Paramoeba atlantica, Strain 621/1 / CCAP 1560/9" /LENGTH=440 /DNA_ID=CAMNT_0047868287 /DNA_START=152 /DNA_END=1474 /DNA_ORIENTATION=+
MYQGSTNLKKVDPLDLLREFAIRKKKDKIILEDGFIIFGDHKFPSKTLTRFHSNKKEPQPLDVLWFCLAQEKKSHAEYVKQCQQFKYNFLSLLDRTELLKFLNGKIGSSKLIYALSEDRSKVETGIKRPGSIQEDDEPAPKKKKFEEELEEEKITTIDPTTTEKLIEAKNLFSKSLDTIPPKGSKSSGAKTESSMEDEMRLAFFKADSIVTNSILQRERMNRTHKNFLLSEKKDFSRLMTKLEELDPKRMERKNASSSGTSSMRSLSNPSLSTGLGGLPPRGRPIIIVPSVITSLITLLNCKEFLENDHWVSPVTLKEQGAKKEKVVLVRKTLREGEEPTTFKVIDSTVQLTAKDWDNVAIVFAIGNAWQFKGWKWNTPVELFSRAVGFYLTFTDERIPETVKSWNVKVISVDQRKRHLDKVATSVFWDILKLRLKQRRS